MDAKELLLLLSCLGLMGGLRLTSTTTTTTFVAAMSIANQDLERYFRNTNASQTLVAVPEDRYAIDLYTYAFLNYTYWTAEKEPIDVNPEEEQARYGEGRIHNVRGKLVHITDMGENGVGSGGDYACTPNIMGTRGEPTPPSGITWIALVRRGRCTFEEKVKNVYDKGALGVIIYNDKPVMSLEKMQIKGKSRNITAVITYQKIGEEMALLVDQGNEMIASIIKGRDGSRPINSLNRTSVLFVSISFIVLMIISLVWLIFYYIQKFRYLQTKDQQSRMLCSVTKKAIMKIPTKTGKTSDEKDADSDCCAICIEAYKPSDCIRVLPCKHEFHKNCIDPWLIEHRTCPMCKLDVLKFYGYVFLGSEESILEYEPERPAATTDSNVGGAAQTVASTQPRSSALTDLIRSRDFVIDFPRVFVMDTAGSATTGTRDSLFPQRIPERSQSTLTLAANATRDWMSQMSNKLDDQHGLRRVRKSSNAGGRHEMQENLLSVRDSTKKRRSRSADGRYSNGGLSRKELARQQAAAAAQQQDDNEVAAAAAVAAINDDRRGSVEVPEGNSAVGARRSSSALRLLTDATYAQSIHRRREELQRRGSAIPTPTAPHTSRQEQVRRASAVEHGDVAIKIQVNGEGIDF